MTRVSRPDHLREFVLPATPVTPVDAGGFDLYLPASADPVPLAVLVHGGPMREEPVATPRGWPVFRGYAAALVARGIAAAVFDHAVLRSLDYAAATARLTEVVAAARAHAGVDPGRVAVWAFSGGGPLVSDLLRTPPAWLRTVALSYPALETFGGVEGFRPVDSLPTVGGLPVRVTRVGREFEALVAAQEEFVAAAGAHDVDLTVIEVPDAHHAFDVVDDTDASRRAIEQALAFVATRLA